MEVMNFVFLSPFRLGGVPLERSNQERFPDGERTAPKRPGEVRIRPPRRQVQDMLNSSTIIATIRATLNGGLRLTGWQGRILCCTTSSPCSMYGLRDCTMSRVHLTIC